MTGNSVFFPKAAVKFFAAALLFSAALLFAQTETDTAAPPAARRPDALQNYRIGRDMESRNRMEEANSYYAEAVRICLEEISRNNSNMDSYTVLTWSLLRQRRYTEVITWGERALVFNTNDYRIVETMGEAYFFLNDYAHSLAMMQRYTASMPRGDRASTAYFFMGEIYRNQKKYQHADIAYTTAVTLEGSMAVWWFRLGSVRESAGDYEQAVPAYERAVALTPNYREAVEALERVKRQAALRPQA
ncbi:MAG: tetratricopeptide repeat protein [Treponema sp.]|jgi:tetratricopeptide (TPR) repeat protein|nr:tetratricopeptide repeat protein [Treponema sp.]